ncbi:MAG TPA: VOC family protein [Chloroflexota bacterium]|nr:VOC family protein [Chloroflexota bacterium]
MTQSTTVTHSVRPIPEGYHSVTPALLVRGGAQAIDFYTRAFGARELGRMPAPDGQRIWHAELQIGDARLMLADEFPDMGGHAPESLGGTPVCLHLYVEDADATVQRAVDAGATVIQPLMDAFWGDRYGRIKDPFGHEWSVATHIEDVPEEEMRRRAEAFATSAG